MRILSAASMRKYLTIPSYAYSFTRTDFPRLFWHHLVRKAFTASLSTMSSVFHVEFKSLSTS